MRALLFLIVVPLLSACGGGGSGPGDVLFTDINPPQVDNLQLDTTVGVAVSGQVTGRDVDGDSLGFFLTSEPKNGSVSGLPPGPGPKESGSATGRFEYQPDPGFVGEDRFSFMANDGDWNSRHGVVAIEVRPAAFAGVAVETSLVKEPEASGTSEQGLDTLTVFHPLPDGGHALYAMDLTGATAPVLVARSKDLGRLSASTVIPQSRDVVFRAGSNIYLWRRDSEALETIDLPIPPDARVLGPIRLSGDGRWLAIAAASDKEPGLGLFAHDLASTAPATKVDLGLEGPVWIRQLKATNAGVELEVYQSGEPQRGILKAVMGPPENRVFRSEAIRITPDE